MCPEGTQTCEYTSTLLEDGNLQMNYKCLSKDGKQRIFFSDLFKFHIYAEQSINKIVVHLGDILLEETKNESASMESDFGEFEMGGFFDRMNQVMNNAFYNPFKWIL